MKRGLVPVLVFYAALVGAAHAAPRLAVVALAVGASAVGVTLLIFRPRGLSWRLATLGATLWAVEEVAWSVMRLNDTFQFTLLTDATYYLGAAAWFGALALAPGLRLPRPLVLAAIPVVAATGWLLLHDARLSAEYVFPFIEFGLALAAIPFLGGLFRGGASEGRLLVLLGFFFRALAAGTYAWLDGGTDPSYLLLWLLGFTCLGIGVYMEVTDTHVEFVATGVAVVAIQLAAMRILTQAYSANVATGRIELIAVISSLAYSQLIVVLMVLLKMRREHDFALNERRVWARLLERHLSSPADDQSLGNILETTLAAIPGLVGVEVHGEVSRGELTGYPYPLVTGGAEVGRLYFGKPPGARTALDDLAPLLAARLQQVPALVKLTVAAHTDPLTGLLNRRGFEVKAPSLVTSAVTAGHPVSVAMVDLDHFKRVNDVYGHGEGDEALKVLARLLKSHVRPSDLVVRWGGEEFLVVFVADLAGAVDAINRARRALQNTSVGRIAWRLGASAGVAGGETPESFIELVRLVERADEALMRAKDAGRGRLELAQP